MNSIRPNYGLNASKNRINSNNQTSQNNYYRIRLYLETEGEDWNEDETDYEIVEKTYPLVLYSNDPSLSQGIPWDGYTFSGRTALFNDGMFNGQQKDISFDLEYKISQLQYGDKLFLQLIVHLVFFAVIPKHLNFILLLSFFFIDILIFL